MNSLEIVKVDKPFHIDKLPLDKVYVIDDYLEQTLHHFLDQKISNQPTWSKTNCVKGQSKTGLPHHQFWGTSFFRGDKNGNMVNDTPEEYTYIAKWLNRKIMTDFGFKWVRFQYMGTNSQTYGQHGTTHHDCDEQDEFNLSFLYYYNTFWNKEWGGTLRFYDAPQQGLIGRDEHIENHQIAEVDFKPNRLLMFDGRIQHGAEAPSEKAKYIDRRSIVIRGDECRLLNREDRYANH